MNTSNHIPFTRIDVEQAMEHLNKATKDQGGISEITTYPTTPLKFVLSRLADESDQIVATTSTSSSSQHRQLSPSKFDRQEYFIAQLKAVLSSCNLFQMEASSENLDYKACMFKLMPK